MIKRTFLIGSLLIGINAVHAQEMMPGEGVQYANPFQTGSARFNAMGGSFGAIGGDISSIHINPAGSAVNVANYATGGLNLNMENNQGNYCRNDQRANETNSYFSNVGVGFNFEDSNPESSLQKATLSVDRAGNRSLDRDVERKGTNENSTAHSCLQ